MIEPEVIMAGIILLSFVVVCLYIAHFVENDARNRQSRLWRVNGVGTLLSRHAYTGAYFLVTRAT